MTFTNNKPQPDSGLCPTCDHVSECNLFTPGQGPVWFCEEYQLAPRMDGRSNPGGQELAGCSAAWPTVLGLCCNCDNRLGCGLPKPEAGVWFCEEYL